MTCKTCTYPYFDSSFEKNTAKCMRHSFPGAAPHMIKLSDPDCELFSPRPSDWEERYKAFHTWMAEQYRRTHD